MEAKSFHLLVAVIHVFQGRDNLRPSIVAGSVSLAGLGQLVQVTAQQTAQPVKQMKKPIKVVQFVCLFH